MPFTLINGSPGRSGPGGRHPGLARIAALLITSAIGTQLTVSAPHAQVSIAQRNQLWAWCTDTTKPDVALGGCTTLIETASLQPPELAATHNSRGGLHLLARRIPEAFQDFTTAVALMPANASYRRNRAAAYGALGEPYKALEDMQQAVRLNPGEDRKSVV